MAYSNITQAVKAAGTIINGRSGRKLEGIYLSIFIRNYSTIGISAIKVASEMGLQVTLSSPSDETRNSRYIKISKSGRTILTIRSSDHAAGSTLPSEGELLDLSSVKMVRDALTPIRQAIKRVI